MTKKIFQVTVFDNGREEWRLNGKLHQDNDLPAIDSGHDYQVWYQHGAVHRDNDLPAYINGKVKSWYKDDKLHRDNDLPAYINGEIQLWYQHGKNHRLTGPASIAYGLENYYIEGKEYTKKEFDEKIKEMNQPSCEGKIVEIDGKKYQLKSVD